MIQVQPEVGETIRGKILNRAGSSNVRTIMSTDLPSEINSEKKESDKLSGQEIPEKKSHWWIWVLILFILAGLGIGAYYLIFRGNLNLF
jgi:hypothetical protein